MSLQLQLAEDLKNAMKAKDANKLAVVRMLKSAVANAAIAHGSPQATLTDDEVLKVIRSQVKQRQDSIEGFEKGGRPELAEKEKTELAILRTYLPAGPTPEAIAEAVRQAIAQTGATTKAQQGLVMKLLKEKLGATVDGRTLSQEVNKQLS